MSEESKAYDASSIVVLTGLEAVRKRPGMYIGTTGARGLHYLVHEVAERALEEVLDGGASRVEVTLTRDGGVRVTDDGRGMRVEGDGQLSALEAQLTQLSYGAQPFDRRSLPGGFFGLGPAVVNALSSRLTVEVLRDGTRWTQDYERGEAATPPANTGPTDRTGTTITFWPDPTIFETVEFSLDALADHFRELAFLNRDLDITLTDEREPAAPTTLHFRFPGGLPDHLGRLHPDVIGFEREEPDMQGSVEVALCWSDSPEERVTSYANSRPTRGGGTHELGFRDGLAAAVNAYAREHQLPVACTPDRLGPGLTAIVSVKLDAPEFEGALRDILGNGPVRACVATAVQENVTAWLDTNPEQAAAILARFADAC